MRMRGQWVVGFALLVVVPGARAQEVSRGPDGGTRTHIAGVEVLDLAGLPFTARTSTEWTRTLADGSTVKLVLQAAIARDSSGRVYRERHHMVPAGSTVPSPLYEMDVEDPTTGTRTTCTMATHQCVITAHRASTGFAPQPAGPFADGTRFLTREALGVNTMQGLNVTGTRETVTVNPGVVGNDRALVSTREFWYSPDLKTNLAVTRNDPREGLEVIQLSEVSRSEPEPARFAVPAGYTVVDARAAVNRDRTSMPQ